MTIERRKLLLKTKTLRVLPTLREGKRRAKDKIASNKSLDVRRKQRLCLERRPLNSNGLGGGFRPRHLRRYTD
jgi:hypothetical protein